MSPEPYYQDDSVTIYHGDCLDLIFDVDVGVVVTDPPYGIAWKKGLNKAAGSRKHTGILNDESTAARDALLSRIPDVPAIVFGSFYAPFPENLAQVLVWRKPPDAGLVGSVTGYRRDAEPVFLVGPWPQRTVAWSSVLDPGAGGIAATAAATGHPHTKPVGLMRTLLDRTPEDSIILDPFMGSGSTLRAAKDLGRKAIGIEIEERYCEVAAERMGQEVLFA